MPSSISKDVHKLCINPISGINLQGDQSGARIRPPKMMGKVDRSHMALVKSFIALTMAGLPEVIV